MTAYLTSGEADTLMSGKPEESQWTGLTAAQKTAALDAGTDAVNGYAFKGSPALGAPTQTNAWPRYIEWPYVNGTTPDAIKYASVLLGMVDYIDEGEEFAGSISSESHGSYSVSYGESGRPATPGQRLRIKANRVLRPYRQRNVIARG